MGESFWQKNRLVKNILFDVCLFEHFSPVANFEQQSILKGNHCILRIRGAPVCQKLGVILENEVVQKLKLGKNVFYKK